MQRTVPCVQDGTDLNFTSRPMTEGPGVPGRNQTGVSSRGLQVHSTLAVEDVAQAEEVLRGYCLRWRIEDRHRVLTTGCRVEELGHNRAERSSRAISIRRVIAWRIMLITLLGRESPELPPDLLFTDVELKVLRRYAMKRKGQDIQTLQDAVIWTAILGGYRNRKHDPPPGTDLTWYGRMKLAAMCEVLELYDPGD